MKQALLEAAGELRIEDVPTPSPGPRDVLVEVGGCGICGTDRQIFNADYPIDLPQVLGHQYAGTVVEIGAEIDGLAVGDRVSVDPNVFCGACRFCRRGEVHLCSRLSPLGISRPGGFAEYSVVPETNAYKVPEGVSMNAAALIEPLACCVRGIQMSHIQPGDTVLLLGAGPMACMLVQLVRLAGAAHIIVSEPNPARRDLIGTLGADVTVDVGEPTRTEVMTATEEIGADVVIEAAGRIETAELALDLARRGGHVVWFGVPPENATLPISPFWVTEKELTISGSYNNPNTHAASLDLVARGRVQLDPIVTDITRLDGLERALDLANYPNAGKIIVDPNDLAGALSTPDHATAA